MNQKNNVIEFQQHITTCVDCRLSELCLPYGLNKDEISELSIIVKSKRPLRADEFLYHQGDQCQNLYAVRSGSFRSYICNTDGTEQTIGFYLPGEIMGLDSLQTGRFSCNVIALETATVCELPLDSLNELAGKVPALQSQLIRIVGREIATDHDKIILLGHRTAREKMATFLLMLSQRYKALGFSSTEFNMTMHRHDIANFLGLTIETVSRQLADLSKNGIITVKQRGVKINNLDSLKAIVEPCLPKHYSFLS